MLLCERKNAKYRDVYKRQVNGSEVHIDIYDDRMEIYSPGGMPDGSIIQDRDPLTVPSDVYKRQEQVRPRPVTVLSLPASGQMPITV